jgi:hypothetical protein
MSHNTNTKQKKNRVTKDVNKITANGIPRPPKLIRKEKKPKERYSAAATKQMTNMLDPAVVAWSNQTTDLFERSEPVPMPLFADTFPCPTVLKASYGATILQGQGWYYAYMYPDGVKSAPEQPGRVIQTQINGPADVSLGSGLYGPPEGACVGVFHPGSGNPMTSMPNMPFCGGFPVDSSPVPFPIPAGVGNCGITRRCAAFGVRLTFASELAATKGFVEFVMPYESTYEANVTDLTARSFDSYRTDSSYRRVSFSDNRTHAFYWFPNCEDLQFGGVSGYTTSNELVHPARMLLRITDLLTTDKVLVEYVMVEELAGSPALAVQTVRHASPDQPHVLNALASRPGNLQPISGTKPPTKIHHHAVGAKVAHHPYLHGLVNGASGYVKTAQEAVRIAKDVAGVITKVGDLFL